MKNLNYKSVGLNRFLSSFFILAVAHMYTSAAAQAQCRYSFDSDKSLVEVSGYKYTGETKVTGKFTNLRVQAPPQIGIADLVKGAKVRASFSDYDSGNVLRTQNILDTLLLKLSGFFGAEASVQKIDPKNVTFMMSINGKKKNFKWPWSIEETEKGMFFKVTGMADILDFIPKSNFLSFSERCKDLHRGPDGISKTWSKLEVAVRAAIVKECQ